MTNKLNLIANIAQSGNNSMDNKTLALILINAAYDLICQNEITATIGNTMDAVNYGLSDARTAIQNSIESGI